MSANQVNAVIKAFAPRGFVFAGKAPNGRFLLHGHLSSPSNQDIPCEIQLDPELFAFPKIRLLELPKELSGRPVPHLNGQGELCYIATGTVVLDIFNPVSQSLACLDRAQHVLTQIMRGEMVDDLAEEFFAYWGGNGWCFSDIQGDRLGKMHCTIEERKDGKDIWTVTDEPERTTKKLNAMHWKANVRKASCVRIKTDAQPRPLIVNWPPMCLRDVLNWQSTLDVNCRRRIHQSIYTAEANKANHLLVIIESPLMTYAFGVLFDRAKRAPCKKLAERRDPTYQLRIKPLSMLRIDDRYLAERNTPKRRTLAGKRIALVGCGTIGGYLADMLVKAGAGTSGGELTLIDPDLFLPQNIGRHRLGFPSLLDNKATAMAGELRRLAPGALLRDIPSDVRAAHFEHLDLLIDATGEEALGHWLSAHYRDLTDILTVWIEGTGTAVRALLAKKGASPCYRCIWHHTRDGAFPSVQGELPTTLAGQGCEGLYVPFPATVSVQAASLGTELAVDWANGVSTPSFRTRVTDQAFELATADCDLPAHEGCPVCHS
ncbi:thiamine biosynthesis protein ThiF [Xanthomonas cerealis pv. cerealis]|uniref:Thiamine biosynthesis protein ThiF n=1 Tax=Xanthomonas cerealis pv. cerealis TaxID=152263 RepID=A0A514E945_9XANT|nr:ThiF family adenylyltransferase [Xanthomonas translucens]QDI02539.1 thiamine biosynthesis protein ThiF [Xanthomonas translucens pv. cerealis]